MTCSGRRVVWKADARSECEEVFVGRIPYAPDIADLPGHLDQVISSTPHRTGKSGGLGDSIQLRTRFFARRMSLRLSQRRRHPPQRPSLLLSDGSPLAKVPAATAPRPSLPSARTSWSGSRRGSSRLSSPGSSSDMSGQPVVGLATMDRQPVTGNLAPLAQPYALRTVHVVHKAG
jgi:hypothetical protein